MLVNYPRPERTFLKAYEYQDMVTSVLLIRDGAGNEYKPEDYLQTFARFIRENEAHIEAVRILLGRPREWSPAALTELRQKLVQSRYRFTVENLQKAHESQYRKALVDIISMVKHAADEEQPLLTAAERVDRAFARVITGRTFTPDQEQWLERIPQHVRENLSVDREDFDLMPILSDAGGWAVARRAFGDTDLDEILHRFNEAIAA